MQKDADQRLFDLREKKEDFSVLSENPLSFLK